MAWAMAFLTGATLARAAFVHQGVGAAPGANRAEQWRACKQEADVIDVLARCVGKPEVRVRLPRGAA